MSTPLPQRILIVDDHADNAESLALVFSGVGHLAEVAQTGEAGIARAMMWQPHLIILDLALPDVPGEEVASALRAGGSRAYIVAYSGFHLREGEALAAGCDAFLLKPELDSLLAIADAVSERATA